MRTIKYFGIGSLWVSLILLFLGVYAVSVFFFFAFCVLSIVYAINNKDRNNQESETKKRHSNKNYAATTWWFMENN